MKSGTKDSTFNLKIRKSMDPLLMKYEEQAVQRYFSYPTSAFWDNEMDLDSWRKSVAMEFDARNHTEGISLNIQLPFCERSCSYCGCNTKNPGNLNAEERYLESLKKQWAWYRKLMKQTPVIRQIYIGGKPGFFSPSNLKQAIQMLRRDCILHPNHMFSIQCDPKATSNEMLHVLAEAGFRKINYTLQLGDPEYRHSFKPGEEFNQIEAAVSNARSYGFKSVNIDLIIGSNAEISSLPDRIKQLIEMGTDRVSFHASNPFVFSSLQDVSLNRYSMYADKNRQHFSEAKLLLGKAGYSDIGLDHFVRIGDALENAFQQKTLHRTFKGYDAGNRVLMIGLGAGALSDIGVAYAQNSNSLNEYYSRVEGFQPGVSAGYHLSNEDLAIRSYMMDICCKQETTILPEHIHFLEPYVFALFNQMQQDGLINFDGSNIKLTLTGQRYIEHICSVFDRKLQCKNANAPQSAPVVDQ